MVVARWPRALMEAVDPLGPSEVERGDSGRREELLEDRDACDTMARVRG